MRATILSLTILASACTQIEAPSAFSSPWVTRQDGTVIVTACRGGGVHATAMDIGRMREAGLRLILDGDMHSACTLALMDPKVAGDVCWTDRTRFWFHAAHVNGTKHDTQTITNLSALPTEIQQLLPPPTEWSVTAWYAIAGHEAHNALGRGYCKE